PPDWPGPHAATTTATTRTPTPTNRTRIEPPPLVRGTCSDEPRIGRARDRGAADAGGRAPLCVTNLRVTQPRAVAGSQPGGGAWSTRVVSVSRGVPGPRRSAIATPIVRTMNVSENAFEM